MNLGDARTRVKSEIGLSSTAEVTLIDGWYNDAVVQFLRKTKCYVKPFSMALTEGEDTYDLPSAILAFKSLYVVAADGTQSPLLDPMSQDEILDRRRFPVGGYQPLGYAIEGWNLLLLSSAAVSSSDLLEGLYVPRPTLMSDVTHDPSTTTYGGVPTEFHEPALIQYALWKAATWDDDASSQEGLAYAAAWEKGLKDAKIELNKRGGIRWAPARPGSRRRRHYIPPTPGTDTGR